MARLFLKETLADLRLGIDRKKPVLVNDAAKKVAKKAARKTALLMICVLAFLVVGYYILLTATEYINQYEFTVKPPVEVAVKTNRILTMEKRTAPSFTVAVTDNVALEKPLEGFYELAKSTGNTEAALFTIALFRDVKETPKVIVATFMAESGFRNDAKNWNCIYYDESGKARSRACAEADRGKAWSVDCGIAQLNFSGTECPKESFDPVWNLLRAREKYDRQGIGAWVAFTTKSHLAHMK